MALRHQVAVLQRQSRHGPKLTRRDRLLFAALYGVEPGVLQSISIVRPGTVVRWRRAGFRLCWKHESSGKAGRLRVPGEVRALIREIGIANPIWGAPRIHGELLKLGIGVWRSAVAKYMARGRHPRSQGWLTFLRNHADGIAAIDLFVVPTIGFRLLFGLVILTHDRRQIVPIAATYRPAADRIARQMVEAFPWETAPRYAIRDGDGAYGKVFRKRLSAMGIRDRPVAHRSSRQNGYGAALHYFTGSKAHSIAIRRLAQQKGLKINEYGVFRGKKAVAGKTEESVFRSVGIAYIPPELREDRGEIQAARARNLPKLVDETIDQEVMHSRCRYFMSSDSRCKVVAKSFHGGHIRLVYRENGLRQTDH